MLDVVTNSAQTSFALLWQLPNHWQSSHLKLLVCIAITKLASTYSLFGKGDIVIFVHYLQLNNQGLSNRPRLDSVISQTVIYENSTQKQKINDFTDDLRCILLYGSFHLPSAYAAAYYPWPANQTLQIVLNNLHIFELTITDLDCLTFSLHYCLFSHSLNIVGFVSIWLQYTTERLWSFWHLLSQ